MITGRDQEEERAKGLLLTETAGSWAQGVEAALPANASPVSGSSLSSVSCPATGDCGAAGAYQDDLGSGAGLLIGGSPAPIELAIATTGKGSRTVSSVPAGIDCRSTCSAFFDAGASLALVAIPSPGSRFSGWSGGSCSGIAFGDRQVNTGLSEQTVTAKFSVPPPCVVPKLEGRTLKTARHLLGLRHCTLGNVKHETSRKIKRWHVISQRPRPGRQLRHGAKVNLVLSKGR